MISVHIFVLISLVLGEGKVAIFENAAKCEAARSELVAVVEKTAPKRGDSVYVGPCHQVTLKPYGPKV